MEIFDDSSLVNTVHNVLHAELFSNEIPIKEKEKIARWTAKRLGIKGSYSGLFAPTEQDFKMKSTLFMGEPLVSYASTSHIFGEEAMIMLEKWNLNTPEVKSALKKVKDGWKQKIKANEEMLGRRMGLFCCGKCSTAYWRGLVYGCLDKAQERLDSGMTVLKKLRSEDGKWKRFPFYTTLWVLNDIETDKAKEELSYAKPVMKRYLDRNSREKSQFDIRRRQIIKTILQKI